MKRILVSAGILVVIALGSLLGQLNQSGGPGSSVAATQSGTWTMQPGNTANTTPWLSTINQGGNSATVSVGGALKVDGSAAVQPVSQNGTWTVQPGNTANTTAWLVTNVPKTTCGATPYDSGLTALPTVSTTVTATATCATSILFANITASSQTVNLTDNAGTPASYLTNFVIPANSTLVYELHYVKMAAGIKWSAGNATSVNAQVVGYQ